MSSRESFQSFPNKIISFAWLRINLSFPFFTDELEISVNKVRTTSLHLRWKLIETDPSLGYQFIIEKKLVDGTTADFWEYQDQVDFKISIAVI